MFTLFTFEDPVQPTAFLPSAGKSQSTFLRLDFRDLGFHRGQPLVAARSGQRLTHVLDFRVNLSLTIAISDVNAARRLGGSLPFAFQDPGPSSSKYVHSPPKR
jgi:hypothetical protein